MVSAQMKATKGQETWATAMKYIIGRKRAEESLGFLAEVSKTLAASVDCSSTLAAAARLIVPFLADWCSVDVIEEDGSLHQVAMAAARQVEAESGERFNRHWRPRGVAQLSGGPQVFPSGKPEARISSALGIADDDHAWQETMSNGGINSIMFAPILARQDVIGSLSLLFLQQPRQRQYGPAEVALAEEVARRLACSIEIGRLHSKLREAQAARHH